MQAETITGNHLIDHLPEEALPGRRLAVVEFESCTPYKGGDYKALTVRTIQGQPKVYVSGYPTAKSLLGRMRWLARVAVAGYTGVRTHKKAEEATIKGTSIPLIPFIFGATKASKIQGLENLTGKKRSAWKGIISLQIEQLNPLVDDKNKIINKVRGRGYPHSKAPIRARFIRFKARLSLDEQRATRILKERGLKNTSRVIDSISDFALSLLIATPIILGIGQATTRGFGRFKPILDERLAKKYNIRDVQSLIGKIIEPLPFLLDSADDLDIRRNDSSKWPFMPALDNQNILTNIRTIHGESYEC